MTIAEAGVIVLRDAVPKREAGKYVGSPVLRTEDFRFLTGRAQYLDDIVLPGMLHAAFARSPYAHARLVGIDASLAEELPGVHAVFTGGDFQLLADPFITVLDRPEVRPVSRDILAVDKVRHVGEAVAMVVADSRYIAEDACSLILTDWEQLSVVLDPEEAIAPGATLIHADVARNNVAHIEFDSGGVDAVFASAARVFSKRFHCQRFMAAPLETRGVIADSDPHSGELTLWLSSQMPHFARTCLAKPLRLTEGKLRVISPDVGGGFGQKGHVFVEDAAVALAARLTGRPIKWIEDRYENLAASTHGKEVICDFDLAVDTEGRFLAFRARYLGDGGAYSVYPWTSLIDPMCAAALTPSLYDVRHVAYTVDCALTNKCQTGAYRGVGWTAGHLVREVLIDDVARALQIDPVDLRLRNTIADEPYVSATGMKYDGGSYAGAIRKAREVVDYAGFRARQCALRDVGRYIGVGFGAYVEPTAWGSASAAANGMPFNFFDSLRMTVEPDGSVVVTTGLHSHGQGHETTFAQVAADQFGINMERVKVIEGDTARAAYGLGTYASRSAVIGGGLIMLAAADMKKRLLRIAAGALEVDARDLEYRDGGVRVAGDPETTIDLKELAERGYFGGVGFGDGLEGGLTVTQSYDPVETYSNGVIVAEVEVDTDTGVVRVDRIVAVEDCGTIINPLIVDGQVAGAVAQGIGGALYEELRYSDRGQFLSGSLLDYLYPSSMEVPRIDIHHLETPSPVTEGGIKGMAEGGSIATPSAVVNAIADALSPFGVAIVRTPVTPADILDVLSASDSTRLRGEIALTPEPSANITTHE